MSISTQQERAIFRKQLRSFGLLMGGVFSLISLWPFLFHGQSVHLWAGVIASVFGILGVFAPGLLAPVYQVWMKIGEKLGWINSRIILAILFFGIVTPIGWLMRLLGKRPLQLGYDPAAITYRVPKVVRDPKHVLKPF